MIKSLIVTQSRRFNSGQLHHLWGCSLAGKRWFEQNAAPYNELSGVFIKYISQPQFANYTNVFFPTAQNLSTALLVFALRSHAGGAANSTLQNLFSYFSASIRVGMFVLPRGTHGMIDASTTRKPSTP